MEFVKESVVVPKLKTEIKICPLGLEVLLGSWTNQEKAQILTAPSVLLADWLIIDTEQKGEGVLVREEAIL